MFGAIADDYTGGADLAGMLTEAGARTVQLFGVPPPELFDGVRGRFEAAVVCLKTRSVEPALACSTSLEALQALRLAGARQIQFKYCSTFDSTPRGNIGPVTEALMRAMGVEYTIAVPALPVNGRTQYLGHLFVNGQLLSESPLRRHPLNPMTDANLVRWLGLQTRLQIGLVDLAALRAGSIRAACSIALVDAIETADLHRIAELCADMPLITGGSGLGMSLPRLWSLPIRERRTASAPKGGTLILAGSCSDTTLKQLQVLEHAGCATYRLDAANPDVNTALAAARPHLEAGYAVCIRSSAPQWNRSDEPGVGERIESAFGEIAKHAGARKIIVAGGETSGAVVKALGIQAAEVTHVIDPGVPALRALSEEPLYLALKSGNFGACDFFLKTMYLWGDHARTAL